MKDPEIIYFSHCDSGKRIFCLEIPEACPLCGERIEEETSSLLSGPRQVPCPFVSSSDAPCSVLIRPTRGDFLHFYSNSADLHIGVTDSRGQVFEYDSQGVKKSRGRKRWDQCLAIPISPPNPDDRWVQHWDYTLAITAGMDTWSASDYQEDGINCYSFVLTFLKMLHVSQLKPSLSSKQQFCSDFMVSRTVVAAKYISLYRQVIRDGASVISAKNNNNCKIDVNDHHSQKASSPTLSGVTEMATVTVTHP